MGHSQFTRPFLIRGVNHCNPAEPQIPLPRDFVISYKVLGKMKEAKTLSVVSLDLPTFVVAVDKPAG